MLKPGHAANAALALAVVGWLALAVASLANAGDWAPGTPAAVLRAHARVTLGVVALGALSLLASAWLSGHARAAAPKRSLVAILICVLPIVGVLVAGGWLA